MKYSQGLVEYPITKECRRLLEKSQVERLKADFFSTLDLENDNGTTSQKVGKSVHSQSFGFEEETYL